MLESNLYNCMPINYHIEPTGDLPPVDVESGALIGDVREAYRRRYLGDGHVFVIKKSIFLNLEV